MGFLYSVVGFLIAISVLVAVHEFGHFWVARKLGVKVLRYSIGFGKPLWKKVAGEDQIEYVIAAIPLGGYVKMLGEGSQADPVDPSERHRAFDNQPIWKRSLIVLAGPGINFLFAILVLMALGLGTEQRVIPVFGDIPENSTLASAGIKAGDTFLAVDGKPAEYLMQHELYVFNKVLSGSDIEITVKNQDDTTTHRIVTKDVPIYEISPAGLMYQLGFVPVAPPATAEIARVQDDSPAAAAGLLAGDKIVAIGDHKVTAWRELTDLIAPSAGQPLAIRVERDGTILSFDVTPQGVDLNGQQIGRIGVAAARVPYADDQLVNVRRSVLEALVYGTNKTWEMSTLTLRMLWKMVTLQVSHKNINGPITIADVSGQALQIGFDTYLYVLAVISISLGVMNLLPIPMLDGGHLLMYAIELVAGQNAAERAFAVGQRLGVLLLICLMSLAFYNDIFRLLN